MQAKRRRNKAFSLLMLETEIAVLMCTDETLPENDVWGHSDVWPEIHSRPLYSRLSVGVLVSHNS